MSSGQSKCQAHKFQISKQLYCEERLTPHCKDGGCSPQEPGMWAWAWAWAWAWGDGVDSARGVSVMGRASPRFRRYTILRQLVKGPLHNGCLSTSMCSQGTTSGAGENQKLLSQQETKPRLEHRSVSDSAAQDLNYHPQCCPTWNILNSLVQVGPMACYEKTPLRIPICLLLSLFKYTNGQLKLLDVYEESGAWKKGAKPSKANK